MANDYEDEEAKEDERIRWEILAELGTQNEDKGEPVVCHLCRGTPKDGETLYGLLKFPESLDPYYEEIGDLDSLDSFDVVFNEDQAKKLLRSLQKALGHAEQKPK